MSESIRVSEAFYEFVASHNRGDETMEETLRRLIGGPAPKDVADILSSDTAAEMRECLSEPTDREGKAGLREGFD